MTTLYQLPHPNQIQPHNKTIKLIISYKHHLEMGNKLTLILIIRTAIKKKKTRGKKVSPNMKKAAIRIRYRNTWTKQQNLQDTYLIQVLKSILEGNVSKIMGGKILQGLQMVQFIITTSKLSILLHIQAVTCRLLRKPTKGL